MRPGRDDEPGPGRGRAAAEWNLNSGPSPREVKLRLAEVLGELNAALLLTAEMQDLSVSMWASSLSPTELLRVGEHEYRLM